MRWLRKLMFWRRDEDEFDVDGCFTLPEARLDCDDTGAEQPAEDLGPQL